MSHASENDFDLSRYELITYGIGYTEENDALYVGERFVRNPELASFVIAHQSPSMILDLLHNPQGGSLVGVKFTWVSMLVERYWNGKVPDPCPLSYFSDLADLCFHDPESAMHGVSAEIAERALGMHGLARKLVGEELVPDSILARLRDTRYRNVLTH